MQAPVHDVRENLEINVTGVAGEKVALQVGGQSIPAGVLTIDPAGGCGPKVPVVVTVNVGEPTAGA
jgi:hypothetical protein